MLNSAIIEVIIGLIFVYSLLSILITQINTVITNLFNSRAKHLKQGISSLVTDPVVRAKVLAHPLIKLVPATIMPEQPMSAQAADAVTEQKTTNVAYVDAPTFSNVLTNVLTSSFEAQLYAPVYIAIESNLQGADEARTRELIRRLQAKLITFDVARSQIGTLPAEAQPPILQTLRQVEVAQQQIAGSEGDLIPFMESLRGVQDPAFRKALETVISTARSLQEAQQHIEVWFDNQMAVLTDLYRRNINYLSLLVAFLMSFILNVDTLHMARTLWDDPALRATLALTATEALESGRLQEDINTATEALEEAMAAPETDADAAEVDGVETEAAGEQLDAAINRAEGTLERILSLRLPIGWEFDPIDDEEAALVASGQIAGNPYLAKRNLWNLSPFNNRNWLEFIATKLVGWLLTTIALAQGAPFWFDLLNRIARGNRRETTNVINVTVPENAGGSSTIYPGTG